MNFSVHYPAFARFKEMNTHLVIVVVWMLAHRYVGIRHDAIFYAGQAVHRLHPDSFGGDLFFQFGSQDEFTLFSPLYAAVIGWLGLPSAAVALMTLAQLAWLLAAAWLLRPLLSGFWYWFGLVLVFSLPRTYGSMMIFQYAEPFLTARSWAEPLALVAAGFAIRERFWLAAGCWIAGSAMHPIMALPAGLLIGLMAVRPWHFLILSTLVAVLLSIFLGLRISPISEMFAPMDGEWLRLAVARSPFTFFDHWSAAEYHEPLLLALLLVLGVFAGRTDLQRRVYAAGFAVLILGIGISLIAAVWPSALLVQIQAWRVLWFVKLLSIAAAVSLMQNYWHRSGFNRLLIGGLAVCAVNIDYPLALGAALGLAAAFLLHIRCGFVPSVSPALQRMAWAVVVLVVALKIASVAHNMTVTVNLFRPLTMPATPGERVFLFTDELAWFIGPALFLCSWWLLRHRPQWRNRQVILTGVVTIACLGYWDRTDPLQVQEQQVWERGIPHLAQILKPEDLVYWDDAYRHLWFGLHRGSYASFGQAAGIVFSRQTAIEAERRLARLGALGARDGHLAWYPADGGPSNAPVTLGGLIHVCHDPILDYVILPHVLPQGRLASFSLFDGSQPTFHLYDCAVLRTMPDSYANVESLR